jgi:hypothetical protein
MPAHRGFLRYFKDAILAVAMLSQRADLKHSPDADPSDPARPKWVKGKSADHADCIVRHQGDVGEMDPEVGLDYMVHVAWRAMAQLQAHIDAHGIDSVIDWHWQRPGTPDLKPGAVVAVPRGIEPMDFIRDLRAGRGGDYTGEDA